MYIYGLRSCTYAKNESQRNHLSVSEYKDAKEKAKELEKNNESIYDRIYDEAMKAVSIQRNPEESKLENQREKLKKDKEKLRNEQEKMKTQLAVVYSKKN